METLRLTLPIFVVNPGSGGGKGIRIWRELCADRPELSSYKVISEANGVAAAKALDRLLEGPVDRLIAVGGDGTAHLTVNRLLEKGRGNDVGFGLIPAGTGSDLARALSLPKTPHAALERALQSDGRRIDVLEILFDGGSRRFVVNVLSLGLSGVVVEMLNRLDKKTSTSYIRGALAAIRSYRPAPCRIFVDDDLFYDGDLLLLAIANGKAFGKGMKIAPEALLDDGLMDIVAICPAPFWKLMLQFPKIFIGTHLNSSIVTWKKGRKARFELRVELPRFDLDGEDLPPESFTARSLPRALKVFA